MIALFKKTIREQLSRVPHACGELSFLKFSTVTSGTRLDDKVIFLVFADDAPEPFLCLKTVRTYAAKGVIEKNFQNLKTLHHLAVAGGCEDLVATPLFLYDDGENAFSIETACRGRKLSVTAREVRLIVGHYSRFHQKIPKGPLRPYEEVEAETLRESGASGDALRALRARLAPLPPADLRLPRIPQHGDLTGDNLLWEGDQAHITDYDYVGYTVLPGFDLFGLMRRYDMGRIAALCGEHLPAYFAAIGAEVPRDAYPRMLFLYHVIAHAQKALHDGRPFSAGEAIGYFERALATA